MAPVHPGADPLDTIVRMRAEGGGGRHRYVRIVATPVEDQAGGIEWVGSVADAEEHWRARTREKLLARMAPVPAARDLSEAFMTTAAAVVPELADAVAIFLVPHEKETDLWSLASPPVDKVERVDLAPASPRSPRWSRTSCWDPSRSAPCASSRPS